MKSTLILLVLAVTCSTVQVHAQPFIGIGSGVACGKGGDLGTQTMDDGTNFAQTRIRGSLGSGIPTALTFGYMSGSCGFFAMLAYFCGFDVLEDLYENQNYISSRHSTAKQLYFEPNFMARTSCDGPLQGYARAGISVPLISSYTTRTVNENAGTIDFEQVQRTKLGLNLGCTGAAGVDLSLGNRLSLFGEVGGTTIAQNKRSSEITMQEIAGVDNLGNLNTSQREINFVKELTNNSNIFSNPDFDSNRPTDQLTSSTPLTRGGILLGARFTF